jgi:hypothetical protein
MLLYGAEMNVCKFNKIKRRDGSGQPKLLRDREKKKELEAND